MKPCVSERSDDQLPLGTEVRVCGRGPQLDGRLGRIASRRHNSPHPYYVVDLGSGEYCYAMDRDLEIIQPDSPPVTEILS